MEPLRHIAVPGFSAVIFRRTLADVKKAGSLLDTSMGLYGAIGGSIRLDTLEWKFPKGGKVAFGHLEHEATVLDWQGAQVPLLCVAKGTPVLMADGTYRPIERLVIDDLVMTLEGARKITRTFAPRQAECVRAVVSEADGTVVGEQVHPTDHPVLTPQGWVSYEGARAASLASSATETHDARKSSSPASMKCQSNGPILDSQLQDRPLPDEWLQPSLDRSGRSGSGACSAGEDTGSAASGDGCQGRPRPQRLTVPVVLHGPDPRAEVSRDRLPPRAGRYASADREAPGCSDRCCDDCGPCDGPPQYRTGTGQGYLPSPIGVEGPCRPCCSLDDQGRARSHSRSDLFEYDHPYTMERRSASESVRLGSCEFVPVGEATVYDIAVDGVNHYVTSSKLVNKNCFDELTHFSRKQFFYLLSRNRSTCGVRPYVRATTNPDADSWVRELIDWWIDPTTGEAIPERSGVLRWFARVSDTLIWGDTAQEVKDRHPEAEPKSLTFIPARLEDNAILMAADPGYRANLLALDPVERARLLGGNWNVRPAAGLYFQRRWCEVVDAVPAGARFVRGWDLAATPKTPTNDPDWTCGTKIGRCPDGRFIVAHHLRLREGPLDVERAVLNTASADGREVRIRLPQDPAQAGKAQAVNYSKLLAGYQFEFRPVTGDKVTRFGAFSAQAQAGNILVLRGEWNEAWFSALESFPPEGNGHDDDADSTAEAFNALIEARGPMVISKEALARAKGQRA